MDLQQGEQIRSQPNPDKSSAATMPILEAQLRHIARTEGNFGILVLPVIEKNNVWWCLRLRLPDNPRELCVVDANFAERRWRQLNALVRFIIRSCGRNRRVTLDLEGVRHDMLRTRGEAH
ncbi:hypothetical protein [Nevskia soli]|uniref:hypothetical protein n=1 Tax=Nevskia soli TaxID=418856 RepID=UPI0012FAF641|nr:hypothetical protein [Nevskia soli]